MSLIQVAFGPDLEAATMAAADAKVTRPHLLSLNAAVQDLTIRTFYTGRIQDYIDFGSETSIQGMSRVLWLLWICDNNSSLLQIIKVPEAAPFTAVLKFAANEVLNDTPLLSCTYYLPD
jgi:hypothetical protein